MLWQSQVQDAMFQEMVDTANFQLGSSGVLEFWAGTVPANTSASDTGTLIATCTFAATPILTPSGLSVTFDTIGSAVASGTGTITYCRGKDNIGNTVFQMTAGETSEEVVFDDADFTAGDTCNVTSLDIDGVFS